MTKKRPASERGFIGFHSEYARSHGLVRDLWATKQTQRKTELPVDVFQKQAAAIIGTSPGRLESARRGFHNPHTRTRDSYPASGMTDSTSPIPQRSNVAERSRSADPCEFSGANH